MKTLPKLISRKTVVPFDGALRPGRIMFCEDRPDIVIMITEENSNARTVLLVMDGVEVYRGKKDRDTTKNRYIHTTLHVLSKMRLGKWFRKVDNKYSFTKFDEIMVACRNLCQTIEQEDPTRHFFSTDGIRGNNHYRTVVMDLFLKHVTDEFYIEKKCRPGSVVAGTNTFLLKKRNPTQMAKREKRRKIGVGVTA